MLMLKYIHMQGQKSHFFRFFLWKNIFVVGAFFFASFLGLNFNTNEVSALFVPTLSASVDQANLQVNGNQVINSTDKTTEIPLNLIVNTNNKTGYTVTLNSETDETALVNTESVTGAKIKSIDASKTFTNFLGNTWGVKVGNNISFSPIPKLTSPMNIAQTTSRTNGSETNNLEIGMKLDDNLESGNYNNKLIFSILTNNYERFALMTEGPDFNIKLKSLETPTNKIEYFKKSSVVPAVSMNAVNIEDEDSDYEIKLWLDPTDETAYYYVETEKVYLNKDSSNMFNYLLNLTDLDLSNLDTSNVTNMNGMFFAMFSLTSLNLSNFNTSNVANMASMFNSVSSLTGLDLSNFDTSRVIDMSGMFTYMSNLTSLDLSSFDTSKVTNMSSMFSYMYSLINLDISNFNTSSVINMGSMFSYMNSLTNLDLSNFDTSNVINMSLMFYNIPKLTTLNLSNFNTSKVTDMNYMFFDVCNLASLDLSSFNTSRVTDMNHIFAISDRYVSNDKLEKIYVDNDFSTSELISYSNMFENRKKLRGGNGSYLTNPSTADKSWLRIDDPTNGRPGYFTRKP